MSDPAHPGPNGVPAKAAGLFASSPDPGAVGAAAEEGDEGEGGEGEGGEGEGTGGEGPKLEGPPVELGPTPESVKELVAACVRFVSARYGVMLDGTPDTLSLLDHYVRDARAEVTASPGALDLLQKTVGAYLGEVLRQQFLGEWYAEGPPEEWRIDMCTVFLTFNPVGMAREAILLEEAGGWHAHLEMEPEDRPEVEARLAVLGDVDEDQFYAPTTRYDVVELAVTALRARMNDRGLGDVRFTSEDYRDR